MELSAGGIAAAASGNKDKHPNCAGAKSTADIGSRENAAKVAIQREPQQLRRLVVTRNLTAIV
jgi:hypothetical protein